MKRKWITFDLDGTLMQNPFGEWVFPEIKQIYKEYVGNEDPSGIIRELVQEHRKRMQAGLIVDAYNWDDIVQCVFSTNGLSVNVDVTELVVKHTEPSKVYLLEERILQALIGLRKEEFQLAAVTNGFTAYQKPVMDVLGLTNLFDTIITPEKVGYGKPQPEMVEELCDLHNEIVAHVGDRIDHDVVFANKLGVLSILLYHDMPKSIRSIDPKNRHEQCMSWLETKWNRETGEKYLPSSAVPSMIVYSIEEIRLSSLQ